MGGPYLLDSLNAHFKLWDTAVGDSSNDRLTPTDIGINTAGPCVKIGEAAGSCGVADCGFDPGKRYYTIQYAPVGCITKFECRKDTNCCTAPVNKNTCWRTDDPANATRVWATAAEVPAEAQAAGFHSCFPGGTTCANGDVLYTVTCGAKTMYIAKMDPGKCNPTCNWSILPANATKCAFQGQPAYMATSQDPVLLYAFQLCACDPGACQAICAAGTFPVGNQCVCICPAGQASQRTCGSGQCWQGSCPAGFCTQYMDTSSCGMVGTCGDAICNGTDDCTNCRADCGPCN